MTTYDKIARYRSALWQARLLNCDDLTPAVKLTPKQWTELKADPRLRLDNPVKDFVLFGIAVIKP